MYSALASSMKMNQTLRSASFDVEDEFKRDTTYYDLLGLDSFVFAGYML
jgi:hypothetical protein